MPDHCGGDSQEVQGSEWGNLETSTSIECANDGEETGVEMVQSENNELQNPSSSPHPMFGSRDHSFDEGQVQCQRSISSPINQSSGIGETHSNALVAPDPIVLEDEKQQSIANTPDSPAQSTNSSDDELGDAKEGLGSADITVNDPGRHKGGQIVQWNGMEYVLSFLRAGVIEKLYQVVAV